jgi:PKD repeat protein
MTTIMRRPRRRSLLLALAVLLLILLCALLIIIIYPIISPPTTDLKADAGGPYTVDEAQPLSFDGSASSGGNITNYEWDFGDGSTGSGVSPSHTYQDGPAQYDVTLTVTDDQGRTASDTTQVTVNNLPPTADAGGPYTCQTGETIQLNGTCEDPSPVDAASLTCTWAEFSGAALSQPNYTCPNQPGQVSLTLTATDKDGASAQGSTTVTAGETQLTADADGPYSGTVGMPVSFDGSGSAPAEAIISYEWDFGDGQTGAGVVISHTYAATGTYTVILTVADPTTQANDVTTATITAAGNELPQAVIDSEVIPKTSDECYSLKGTASTDPDGEIVSYVWDLGDGNEKVGPEIEYCYQESGSYTVTLTVTDDAGATDSASVDIEVP